MYTYETRPPFKPILVVCYPKLTRDQRDAANRHFAQSERIKESGWVILVLDGFDKPDVRAFGVSESNFAEFEELKAALMEAISNENGK